MPIVIVTALGVGCATILGALIGFLFKNISHKFNDVVLSFAAGIMLAAAVVGLILPSLEYGENFAVLKTTLGVMVGAVFLNIMDRFTPHLHKISGADIEAHKGTTKIDKVMLFVMAIAIHNLPEGIATGVSFGTENIYGAITIAIGIALQNIPEGMIIIAPLLGIGVSKWKTFGIAAFTGVIEIVGTLLGYFAVSIATVILPFALAFAGGTMLYIISDEIIPETHSHGYERVSTYSLLIGFMAMIAMTHYLG